MRRVGQALRGRERKARSDLHAGSTPTPAAASGSGGTVGHRGGPAARRHRGCSQRRPQTFPQRGARAGCSAPLRCREAQGLRPRAQRASTTDSSHLSERSERSERSELCDGAARPSIAGQSTRSGDRLSEALRPARAPLCRADMGPQRRPWRSSSVRERVAHFHAIELNRHQSYGPRLTKTPPCQVSAGSLGSGRGSAASMAARQGSELSCGR